jgi:hypothetical protein
VAEAVGAGRRSTGHTCNGHRLDNESDNGTGCWCCGIRSRPCCVGSLLVCVLSCFRRPIWVTVYEIGGFSPGTGDRACLRSGTGGRHGDLRTRELRVRVALVLSCVGWGRGGDVGDWEWRGEVADWAHRFGTEVVFGRGRLVLGSETGSCL